MCEPKTAEMFRNNPKYGVQWNGTQYVGWLDETTDDEIALVPVVVEWDEVTEEDITRLDDETFTEYLQDPDMPFNFF